MLRLAFAAGIFVVTVFAGVLVVRAGPEHDVNQDGLVDLTDALDVLAHFGEEPPAPTPTAIETYEVTGPYVTGLNLSVAACDPGDAVTGGGATNPITGFSHPSFDTQSDETGWKVVGGAGNRAIAVCIDNRPPHDRCANGDAFARWVDGNGNCYQRWDAPVTDLLEAEKQCQWRSNGHLVSITSAAEQDFLWTHLGGPDAWIGYSDAAIEGSWIWLSGESSAYSNWAAGEPNNGLGGPYENAAMWFGSGFWNDTPASEARAYICEFAP